MYNEYLTAVAQFPNVFSADECRFLINLPLPVTDAAIEVRSADEMQKVESGKLDYGYRRTRIKPIPPDAGNAWIFQRLARLIGQVNQQAFHFQLNDVLTADVLEYSPDGFFDWHVDVGAGIFSTRKLSVVCFLTPPEEYEGGNLCFMDQGAPLRLPQGTTAIFPSYLVHKVEPVKRGTRFTLVAWAHGPSFS